jgi:hypothetical protein
MCPKPLHTKQDVRGLSQGANFDSSTQYLGTSDSAEYIDANNVRHTDGDQDSVTKIGGELLTYPALNNACFLPQPYGFLNTGYDCIGTANFFLEDDKTNHIIEFWAHSPTNLNFPAFIRIDGIVVLYSDKFPITFDHPLQLDKNENCVGGEIYITDYNVPPMIFNLKDLMVNGGFTFNGITLCTQKYFSEFNIDEYIIELVGDNNHPIFIQTTKTPPAQAEVIGSNGLNPGMYQYQISKVTRDGDRTAWSKATPMIPVGFGSGSDSAQYPFTKTYGGETGGLSTLGVHLRFRVDNKAGYDFLEIKRTAYNLGAAPGTPGIEKLLDYRLALQPDDFFIKDVFDNGALELDLPAVSANTQFGSIKRAKSVRYYNKRLSFMNVEFQQRNLAPQITFSELNGKKMFPVVQKMTTPTRLDGHKNAYNYAYYRTLTRGEKYGWATEFFDGNNQVSFAVPIPDNAAGTENYHNYQMPNRREIISAETDQYSNATVKAATVEGTTGTTVAQTHEVFDTVDSVTKTDSTTVINVTPLNGAVYTPFHPTSQNDPNSTGHNYQVNTDVFPGSSVDPVTLVPYNPQAFGLNYFALGMGLSGITTIPPGIKAFSVVRTRPAQRVFAQGIAYYRGQPNSFDTKILNTFYFYSPDLDQDNGIEDFQKIIDSVNSGENRYKIQAVSPLGFFTEAYSAHYDTPSNRWTCCDMVNYARILREDGSINTGDAASNDGTNTGVGMDSPIPDGFGYTGYGKWRTRNVPIPGTVFPNAGNGNQLFDITGVATINGANTISNRFTIAEFTLSANLFDFASVTSITNAAFNEASTQDWHEPMYIVNIIDTVADIPIQNTINYIETEHYQKVEAWVGTIQGGVLLESFLTVDERPDDFSITQANPSIDKIIFTKDPNTNLERVWLNVTGLTVPQVSVIATAIQAGLQTASFNGTVYNVDGVYTLSTIAFTPIYNEVRIVFDPATNPGGFPATIFKPNLGDLVLIRYNTAEAIKSFGGETTIHESVFCRADTSVSDSGGLFIQSSPLSIKIPFPYGGFNFNNNYRRPSDMLTPPHAETIDFFRFFNLPNNTLAQIRQALCMFTCESRISLPQEFEINSTTSLSEEKYFPATHYIPRPPIGTVNAFFAQFDTDYPGEQTIEDFGGFRFKPQVNLDYSAQDENHGAVSAPQVGFIENTLFCTGIVASLERAENVVNAPGLRTFPATNFWIISDDTGDIKYAYDELTEGKGNNLWAITESGVCLLVTDKTILYQSTGTQLAAIGVTGGANFITGQIWISKSIGMNDEFWRSAAEGYNVIKGDFSERRTEALFFSNALSQYRLSGGALLDIARGGKYHSRVFPDYLNRVGKEYVNKVSSVYDFLNDEYWACIQVADEKHTVVFAEKKEHYRGTFDYRFDKFTSFDGKTYGMRNAETYLLDQYGETINFLPVEATIVAVSAKEINTSKNFSRIRITPPLIKPTKILFYGTKEDYLTNTDRAEIDTVTLPLSLKNYSAWEGFIPRKVAGSRNRVQGTQVIFVIKSLGSDRFKVNTVSVGFSEIK